MLRPARNVLAVLLLLSLVLVVLAMLMPPTVLGALSRWVPSLHPTLKLTQSAPHLPAVQVTLFNSDTGRLEERTFPFAADGTTCVVHFDQKVTIISVTASGPTAPRIVPVHGDVGWGECLTISVADSGDRIDYRCDLPPEGCKGDAPNAIRLRMSGVQQAQVPPEITHKVAETSICDGCNRS